MVKKKLFITGASGFLGYHLLRVAQEWEVYGVTNLHNIGFENATLVNCDIRNYIELGNYIDDIEPDAIIHAAAISDANFCEQNRELSYDVNVEASKNLAGIAADYNIPFAFTSTDLVFDGKKGMYKEDDAKNPVSVYGEQKSVAEEEILKIYPNATVFRLPLMFGEAEASEGNYLRKFIAQLRNGEKANLFYDEYRSVCGAKSIAEGILQLLFTHEPTIHLAGKGKLSRYDFGMKVAEAFNLDKSLLQSLSQKDIQMAAPRPADVSLDISRALSLGYKPMPIEDELKAIAQHKYL
ncbi:MAG TPA: NAD(P)-dependent oxidoreductase [Chitinophagales bacterium]|nr:NAD(P)-dependent oxidoreductase [Chitinophagales bacterium]